MNENEMNGMGIVRPCRGMGDRWGPVGWAGTALIIGASAGSQLLSFEEMKEEEEAEQKAINAATSTTP